MQYTNEHGHDMPVISGTGAENGVGSTPGTFFRQRSLHNGPKPHRGGMFGIPRYGEFSLTGGSRMGKIGKAIGRLI